MFKHLSSIIYRNVKTQVIIVYHIHSLFLSVIIIPKLSIRSCVDILQSIPTPMITSFEFFPYSITRKRVFFSIIILLSALIFISIYTNMLLCHFFTVIWVCNWLTHGWNECFYANYIKIAIIRNRVAGEDLVENKLLCHPDQSHSNPPHLSVHQGHKEALSGSWLCFFALANDIVCIYPKSVGSLMEFLSKWVSIVITSSWL